MEGKDIFLRILFVQTHMYLSSVPGKEMLGTYISMYEAIQDLTCCTSQNID